MALGPFTVHLRLLSPVFLVFVAWIVWRTPYQERANRVLAAFLAVLALGFSFEVLWDMARGEAVLLGDLARMVQDALGFVDPPLLLAFALVVSRPRVRRPALWLWVSYGLVGTTLFLLGRSDSVAAPNLLPFADIVYVNGTYLAAFVLLVESFRREERRFMARQMRFLVLGVGFAALSRTSALFMTGGPALLNRPTLWSQMVWSAPVTVILLLVVGVGLALRSRLGGGAVRPVGHVLAWVGSMVGGFYVLWAALGTAAIGSPFEPAVSYYFTLRWIVFAAVVGYGILRYQLFDFELRTRQVVALLVALVVGVAVAMAAGQWAWQAGVAVLPARLLGLPAGAAVAVPLFLVLERMGRSFESAEHRREDEHRRRLEIYQATLEFALEKPEWSEDERRFVETLREVFEVSPEEHETVVASLREHLPRPGPAARGT